MRVIELLALWVYKRVVRLGDGGPARWCIWVIGQAFWVVLEREAAQLSKQVSVRTEML